MRVLVATNNPAKVKRYRELLRETDVELLTPADLGISAADVVEDGAGLRENAEKKARAYEGLTDLPILANDTGFYVEGEGFVDAPKRHALGEKDEHELTQEEIAAEVLAFWKGVAARHGGKVDAAWPEVFVLVMPDGSVKVAESRREILLTDQEFAEPHPNFPLRSLYLSKSSGKPAVLHTREEEDAELAPVREALVSLLLA